MKYVIIIFYSKERVTIIFNNYVQFKYKINVCNLDEKKGITSNLIFCPFILGFVELNFGELKGEEEEWVEEK